MTDPLQIQDSGSVCAQIDDERLSSRFWDRVFEQYDGCWVWTGAKLRGYGQLTVKGRTVKAHRHAYEALVGPIPDGLAIDHLCRNPSCVNPAHLEPVTWAENIHRGTQSKITMEIARDVRRMVVAGHSNAEITRKTGVTTQNIWWIAEDKAWREDPDAPRQPVWPKRDCVKCGKPVLGRMRTAVYCTDECRKGLA